MRKQLEIEPQKNFDANMKSITFLDREGEKLGSVGFPETTFLLGLNYKRHGKKIKALK